MEFYYMNKQGEKEGPYDQVTMMRRIKSGKILPDSWVYIGDAHDAAPAHQLEELRVFFNRSVDDIRQELAPTRGNLSLERALRDGWLFTTENQLMPAFAGAALLFAMLFGFLLNSSYGMIAGVIGCWFMFFIVQSFYFVIALRVYRGQALSMDFMSHQIGPILINLLATSLLFAVLAGIGSILFILPAVVAFLVYSLIPFMLFDHKFTIPQAINSSITLLKKLDASSATMLAVLLLLYLAAIGLIFPIPLVMPILAGAMCSLYEDLAAS